MHLGPISFLLRTIRRRPRSENLTISFLLRTIVRFATYGPPSSRGGGSRPVACQQHKLASHVDVRNKMCEEAGCAVQASFGPPETVCPLVFSSLPSLLSLSLSPLPFSSLSLFLPPSLPPFLSILFPIQLNLYLSLSSVHLSIFPVILSLYPSHDFALSASTIVSPSPSFSFPTPFSSLILIHNFFSSFSCTFGSHGKGI